MTEQGFQVVEGYGIVFCEKRQTISWFKDGLPGLRNPWPCGDDKISMPYVHDKETLRIFMYHLQTMFSEKNLRAKEISLPDENYIALVFYE